MKTIDEKISELEQQLREAKAEKKRIALENPTTIGGRIYRVMRIKGITQTELGKEIGYTYQTIGRYLNNQRKISAEAIGKIAKILDVSCDYLILGETNGSDMTNTVYVIRNNYSGVYVHKTLFRIRAFRTKYEALRYMRTHGVNERYYEVVEVRWKKSY